MANRNSKNWNRGSIFKKFSASLTVLVFLASSNLSVAALANEQGGRGAAWAQFKAENPDLHGAQLNQAFRQQWNGNGGSPAAAAVMSLSAASHVQSVTLTAGSPDLQIINPPVTVDLQSIGTTIQNGVQTTVEAGGNVTLVAPSDIGNVQIINAPPALTPTTAGSLTAGGNVSNVTGVPSVGSAGIVLNSTGENGVVTMSGGQEGVVNTSGGTTGGQFAVSTGSLAVNMPAIDSPAGVGSISTNGAVTVNAPNFGNVNIGATNGNTKNPHHVKEPKVPHTPIVRVNNNTLQQKDNGKYISVKGGLALDLGSALETITLGDKLFQSQSSVTISVGGQEKTVSSGSKVTAAEYIAAKQALAGGSQTVTLDADGRATGGVVDLSAMTTGNDKFKVTNLTVPVAVTAAGDFGKGGDVKITGDLNNSGAISAFTSDDKQVNALIRAGNITNGGSITSAVSDLTLQADKSLNNYGDISASGNLTLSAGKTLTNSGDVVASGNLNVLSPVVANTGTLASSDANVNLDTPVAAAMSVNNNGGTIEALNGAINVRSASYASKYDSALFGGDLLSQEVNAYTGLGTTNINVNELTGVVNTNGSAAHVSANTDNLILGNQCLVDDPTYYNTGNIVIGGNINVGERLAIIAGGDITAAPGLNDLTIMARLAGGNQDGQDIFIIAGANVTGTGSQTAGNLSGNPPANNATSATVNGASATGGNIDLSTVTGGNVIDARANTSSGNGGNIILAAYEAGGNNGKILLSNTFEVNASSGGDVGTTNGSIKILAGATGAGDAITVGSVISNSNSNPADIVIANAQPVSSDGSPITFNSVGAVTSGNTLVASSTVGGGNVSVGGFVSSRGNVNVSAGGALSIANLEAGFSGSIKLNSVGDMGVGTVSYLSQGAAGFGTLLLTSQGNISFSESIRANGGIVVVAGEDVIATTNNGALFTEKDGNTGSISVVAGADFQVNAGDVTITGASITGGSIRFNEDAANKISKLSANSNNNGSGGEVNLIAYNGKVHLPGDFPGNSVAFSVEANSNNNDNSGSYANGTINIVAGADTADAIQMGGALAIGSPNSTGSINIFAGAPNNNVVVSTSGATFAKPQTTFVGTTVNPDSGVLVTRTLSTVGGNISIAGGSNGVQFADVTTWRTFDVNSLGNIVNQGSSALALLTGAGERENTLLWTALGDISFSGRIKLHASGSGISDIGGGGGVVIVAGGTIQSVDNNGGFAGPAIETNSGYDGGNIAVVAGADFTRSGNTVTINGQSGTGGSILFDGSATPGFTGQVITHVDAHSQGGTDPSFLDGGNVTLISYNDILLGPTGSTLLSAAAGTFGPIPIRGTNGTVTIVAPGAISLPKIELAQEQGGSATVRAATPSSASINVTPFSTVFGTVAGSFTGGALSSSSFSFAANNYTGTDFSFATLGDVSLGTIDVHSNVAGVSAGTVFIQGANVVVGDIDASHGGAGADADGDAGSVTILTNSSTQFQSGTGSAGGNRSGEIDLGMSGVGNGGTLNLTNAGSGGITLTSAPTMTVNEGNGANLTLDAGTGALDITPLGSTISVNAATQTTVSHNGGNLTLRFGSIAPNVAYTLNADSTGTSGNGGYITLENTVSSLFFGTGLGEFVASASGVASGTIDATAATNISISGIDPLIANEFKFDADGVISLGAFLTGSNLTANAGVQIGIDAALAFGGSIKMTAPTVTITNDPSVSANDISIEGPSLNLQMNGGVEFDGVVATRITASSGDLTLSSVSGSFLYTGGVILSAGGIGQAIVATGTVNTTDSDSYLITTILNGGTFNTLPGGSWTTVNPPAGTFANNAGLLTLSGAINFGGGNLAIISSGDIDLTGATINLDGALDGGTLIMLAGYSFNPATAGQIFSQGLFDTFASSGPGSILGGASISTRGISGNGGNVIAAANGTITLGNIDTRGLGGNGGVVRLIATDGIDLTSGSINAGTGVTGGSVQLSIATASLPLGFSITNGTASSTNIGAGTVTAGNIAFGGVDAQQLILTGGLNGGDTISHTGALNVSNLQLIGGGSGTATLDSSAAGTVQFIDTFNGVVNLSTAGDVGLTVSGANQNLNVNAGGRIISAFTPLGAIATANLQGFAGAGTAAVSMNLTTSGAVTVTSLGGGDITGSLNAGGLATLDSSGRIGTNTGLLFNVSAPSLALSAPSGIFIAPTAATTTIVFANAPGGLFLSSSANNTVNINTNVDTGLNQLLLFTDAGGAINIGGILTSSDIVIGTGALALNGSRFLTAANLADGSGGSLAVNVNTITSGLGTIVFEATSTGNTAGGSINFLQSSNSAVTVSDTGTMAFDASSGGVGNGGIIEANFGGDVTITSNGFKATGGLSGGSLTVIADNNISVNSGTAINLFGGTDGATIILNAGQGGPGNLALNNVGFIPQANALGGSNGNGGVLDFRGTTIGFTSSQAFPLEMTARGDGNGNGGTIRYITGDTTAVFVGPQAKAPKAPFRFITADASTGAGGTGNGGTIDIEVGGNLTISDTSLVTAARGAGGNIGANYTFKAGTVTTGALVMNGAGAAGSLDATGLTDGGTITLASRSSTKFSINLAASKNGIAGTLNAGTDGEINVTNLNGGVHLQTTAGVTADEMHFTMGGSKGAFTSIAGVTINAVDELTFAAGGGSIGGKVLVNVNTASLTANTIGKGVVGISNISGAMTLEDSSSGANFTLVTTGSALVNNLTTLAKGSILVRTGSGNLSVANNSTLTANGGALTLQNTNLTGQIVIGDGATVETQQRGKNTTLVIGATIPTTGTNPTTVDVPGIDVTVVGKGVVFLGAPGTISSTTAFANAIEKPVIFQGNQPGSIVLGAGVTITADPPSPTPSVATAAALPAQSAPNMSGLFAFMTENATVTSDLSVLNLNAAVLSSGALHAPVEVRSGALHAPSQNGENNGLLSSGLHAPSNFGADTNEDNSYAVGYCPATGYADGAICSDSDIVDGQISQSARIQTIQHSDRVVIKKGNVLFVPFKNTTVETPHGIVHIQAKSIALVSSSENGLAVYDLEDQHKGSVSVESNGHNVVLSPGRHVTITPHHSAEFAQINALETIAHRNVQSAVKNGHRAHTSEFSVLSAMDTVKPLAAMVLSKNAHAKQIADRMMKTTAIILQIGGAAGKYQHHFKPRMTAMR